MRFIPPGSYGSISLPSDPAQSELPSFAVSHLSGQLQQAVL